jgi:hypothetical protein
LDPNQKSPSRRFDPHQLRPPHRYIASIPKEYFCPKPRRTPVADLKNDEQIDAAVQAGIFLYAFCFNNQHKNTHSVEQTAFLADVFGSRIRGTSPTAIYVPERRIYEIGEICAVGCEAGCHGDDCYRLQANQVLESVMLDQLIATGNLMAVPTGVQSIADIPFVLDIDLDYFRSIKSLSPEDTTTFYRLIRDSVAITIATEPNFVKDLRIDDDLTSDLARAAVMAHIQGALSQ